MTLVMLGILCTHSISQHSKVTLSGYVKDAKTGEDLIGATVHIPELSMGTVTNEYGFYSLSLDPGEYQALISYIGFEEVVKTISLNQNTKLNIELGQAETVLGEVTISAEKERVKENVTSAQMSAIDVKIEMVKKMPALFGEVDIIKSIQLLPGVKSVGEGSSGFYVRGGNVDQNLVLLDEAPIYNASHVLGFFSSFNPDAIKDMKLFKGGMPAVYGGRLSSVLDIRMKEGNAKKFAASGGIGTLMSRLAIEAPIGENASFMISGRRSYIDLLTKAVQSLRGEESNNEFYFYDLNAKLNYKFSDRDRVFFSGYFGRDVIRFSEPNEGENTGIEWGNRTATLRWNHIFSPKLFSNITFYTSKYDYFLDFDENVSRFKWDSILDEWSGKLDLGYYMSPQHTIKAGGQVIHHRLRPGNIQSFDNNELIQEFVIDENKSLESAVYIQHDWNLTDKIKIDYGLRYSWLSNLGPQKEYSLNENYEITDTINHSSGIFNTFQNFEPRAAIRYLFPNNSSLKASYNRTAQYIQLASNGNTATPFDIWFSSTPYVKPQLADQWALGYFKNIFNNTIELSAEIYYKKFSNAIDFKDHASLLFNRFLEQELRFGEARSYGLELMAKKSTGRFSGWVSYTLSKAEKKIETINNNKWYNAKYDKPHDISIVAAYELNDRISLASNFVYSTGSAVTFPTGRYEYQGKTIPVYSDRNDARLPDYHRLDFSLTLKGKNNPNRRFQSEWVFSIYNLYHRKNAFTVTFKQDEANPNVNTAIKESIFGIVPSITYNAKF